MTDNDLLTEIKERLSITGTYQDKLLLWYAKDVKLYLQSSGISEEIVNSEKSVGLIVKGVTDLWLNGGKFSEFFNQRLIQLCLECKENV